MNERSTNFFLTQKRKILTQNFLVVLRVKLLLLFFVLFRNNVNYFCCFLGPSPLFGQSGASHNSPSEAHQSSGTLNRYGISANTMPICQLPIAEKAKKNDITRELLWLSSNRLSRPHGKGIANVTVLVFTHY